jgi:hypothetical protein
VKQNIYIFLGFFYWPRDLWSWIAKFGWNWWTWWHGCWILGVSVGARVADAEPKSDEKDGEHASSAKLYEQF